MIHDDHRFTIYNYYVCVGDCKTSRDFNWDNAIPIDDPNFPKMIEFAMKIKVLFNDYGKVSYAMYKQKNNHGQYFWKATKRVNRKLRNIYVGYNIPDRNKLDELAQLFNLSDTEFYKIASAKRTKKRSELEP